MDPLRFEVRRTRADIWNGITANLLRAPTSYISSAVGILIVSGIAVFVNLDEGLAAAALAGAVAVGGMMLLYALMYAFCIYIAVRKTLKLPDALDPVSYVLSPEGLGALAKSGQGQSAWELWPVAFETKSIFVIRHQLNLIQIIPKRYLAPDLVADIRAMLVRYVRKTSMQKAAA
jgi:hypothetical protein